MLCVIKDNIMKFRIFAILLFTTLIFSSCFDFEKHDHAFHALQAQEYVVKAIYLEDSLHIEKYKNEYLDLMGKAIQESKYAKKSELNGLINNWGNMFHDHMIKGAKLTVNGDKEENIGLSLQMLTQATEHLNKYSEWYKTNALKMQKKLEILKK